MRESSEERKRRLTEEIQGAPTISAERHRRYTRRSFLTGGVAALTGAYAFRSLWEMDTDGRIPVALRKGHEFNRDVWSTVFREDHLAPTFLPEEASILRVNGQHGIREDIDFEKWTMQVESADGSVLGAHSLRDIRSLPKYEMTIEHKCVEGWSQITTWAGARFSDFAALYPEHAAAEYVAMETPNGEYYVGNDRATMMHPQTLLVYEMVGEPLDREHGAPLRLATPLKYGIKQLKRIGLVRFQNEPPADYWAERGYDYYSAL